ncbi:DUF2490 domain-containing protein [Rufibacter immobilis]|uniref:DUF2490 domain-containing protein n=1 Tax=Rufibacter immobilis TaxID=1348778 RepID=A0A3M9MXP4_9BACT|nr:DUF2490 domain-containing protein [Rufibacter immobilis]RNI30321.1 DUF2490 domain-containing protein [Rufibacter immobilis]
MKLRIGILGLLGGFLLATAATAQRGNVNHWLQYSGSYWINPQWVATANLQYRTYRPVKDPRTFFTGAELQYNFKKAPVSLLSGYAHLFNRNYLDLENTDYSHENRLYQQVSIRGQLWKASITHRYQVEERWLPQGYHTRFRYSVALRVPIGSPEREVRPWYGIFRNEVRVIVRDQPFDSNRVFGGVGYTFSKHFTLEGMWMSQLAGGGNHQHFTMFVLKHDFGRME